LTNKATTNAVMINAAELSLVGNYFKEQEIKKRTVKNRNIRLQ
jgi:hypothetical protein